MLPVSRLSVILFPHGRKYSLRRSRIFKLNRNYCVPIKYAFSSPNKNETIREHTGIFGGVLVFCLRCDYIFYDDDDDGNDGSHSIHIFMCILNNCVVFRVGCTFFVSVHSVRLYVHMNVLMFGATKRTH